MRPKKSTLEELTEKAVSGTRQPRPERLQEPQEPQKPQKRYRTLGISLYTPEAEWVDEITRQLRTAGNPKANRSLLIREAIWRLREDLEGKTPTEILHYLTDRQAHRGLHNTL